MTDRTFGIELEMVGANTAQVFDALNAAGIPCHTGWGVPTPEQWRVKRDGSLQESGNHHGTCELVSPILRGDEGLEQIRRVCQVLSGLGATANRSCGFHVHFGAADLTLEQWKLICKRWVRDEKYIAKVLPESRQRNNYCKRNDRWFSSFKDAVTKIDRAQNFDELSAVVCGRDRYHMLNLVAWHAHHTLEIRAHSGTVDADKVVNWVVFLDCLIMCALRVKYTRSWNSNQDTFELRKQIHYLMLVADVPNEVRRFYCRRAVELAEGR